jgi:hypothetical protein
MPRNCTLVSKNVVMRAIQQTESWHLFIEASTCCCEASAMIMRKTSYKSASRIEMRLATSFQGELH